MSVMVVLNEINTKIKSASHGADEKQSLSRTLPNFFDASAAQRRVAVDLAT